MKIFLEKTLQDAIESAFKAGFELGCDKQILPDISIRIAEIAAKDYWDNLPEITKRKSKRVKPCPKKNGFC